MALFPPSVAQEPACSIKETTDPHALISRNMTRSTMKPDQVLVGTGSQAAILTRSRRPGGRNFMVALKPPLRVRPRAPGQVGNLPRALSSFVGRHQTVADLARDVSTTGLLSLVGVGGIGKTRLALAVASALREQYAHGAWLVELAPVADPTQVAGTVAAALGIRERPGSNPLETLGVVLRRRQLLLVLDNCEHVLQSSSELVATLLQSCDNLSVLATSRELLGVPGEVLRTVPPLSIPSLSATFDQLAESDAVQLFVERVRASRSTFSLTPQVASAAGQICRRLDGLPLAIELAAVRAKSMSLAEIASRLDDPLGLLTGGPRAGPRRHQALRAAIDWSFDLLSDPERKLLRRVAIFNGGFTVDSARQVCSDAECPSEHVVDLLDRLVNQSFVNVDTRNDTSRFTMLETLRQYGLERLEQAGEASNLRERYRDWCLELVSRVPPEVFDPGQVAILEPEIENLSSALRWAIETEQVQDAARLSIGIMPWWFLRGSFAAGRAALISVLDLASDDPTQAELPQVALLAAQCAGYQGDYDAAEGLVRRAQAFALASRNTDAQVFATTQLGWLAVLRGDTRRARDAQSRAMSEAPIDGYLAQLIRFRLAIACIELGELARAQQLIDTMRDRTTTESRFLLYRIQKAQALLAERAGDYVEADRLLDDSLTSERAAGELSEMIETLTFRGIVALERGERQRQRTHSPKRSRSRHCVGAKCGLRFCSKLWPTLS
jgi:predicted ATPase